VRLCRKIHPKQMDEWPPWLRDIWLGMPGREYGEIGLLRTTARKYSRQLNSSLALASQVSAPCWVPCRAEKLGIGRIGRTICLGRAGVARQ